MPRFNAKRAAAEAAAAATANDKFARTESGLLFAEALLTHLSQVETIAIRELKLLYKGSYMNSFERQAYDAAADRNRGRLAGLGLIGAGFQGYDILPPDDTTGEVWQEFRIAFPGVEQAVKDRRLQGTGGQPNGYRNRVHLLPAAEAARQAGVTVYGLEYDFELAATLADGMRILDSEPGN